MDAWKSSAGNGATIENLIGTFQKHEQTAEVIQHLQDEFGKQLKSVFDYSSFVIV